MSRKWYLVHNKESNKI